MPARSPPRDKPPRAPTEGHRIGRGGGREAGGAVLGLSNRFQHLGYDDGGGDEKVLGFAESEFASHCASGDYVDAAMRQAAAAASYDFAAWRPPAKGRAVVRAEERRAATSARTAAPPTRRGKRPSRRPLHPRQACWRAPGRSARTRRESSGSTRPWWRGPHRPDGRPAPAPRPARSGPGR